MSQLTSWIYGDWTLKAEQTPEGIVVNATKTGRRYGTRHGRYLMLPNGDVLTISMADTKVNTHMRTAKVRTMLNLRAAQAKARDAGNPA